MNSKSSLHSYFISQDTRWTRTGENRVKVPDIGSAIGRRSFSYRGPVYWNSVPEELKNSESVDAYK